MKMLVVTKQEIDGFKWGNFVFKGFTPHSFRLICGKDGCTEFQNANLLEGEFMPVSDVIEMISQMYNRIRELESEGDDLVNV